MPKKIKHERLIFREWADCGPMELPKWNNPNPYACVIPPGKVVLPQGNRANGCEM